MFFALPAKVAAGFTQTSRSGAIDDVGTMEGKGEWGTVWGDEMPFVLREQGLWHIATYCTVQDMDWLRIYWRLLAPFGYFSYAGDATDS